MVGQCVLSHTLRLQGEHWIDDVCGIRVNNEAILESKNKWEELNRIQDSGIRQCLAIVPVVRIIY